MGNRGIAGYHGRYTVSEFALVKGELLKKYGEKFSAQHIDQVCRYIAKHSWQNVRTESYVIAFEMLTQASRDVSIRMLLVYDEAQRLFDLYHHGESFVRNYQALPKHVQKFLEEFSNDDGEGHRANQADRAVGGQPSPAAPQNL